jgi:hypothetical protein
MSPVCFLPLSNISNVPIVHTWLLNFPIHSQSPTGLSVTGHCQEMEVSHPSRWSRKHGLRAHSWYPFFPCAEGMGRSQEHWLQAYSQLLSEIQSHLLTSLVGLTWVLRYFSKQPGVVQPSSSQRSQQWQRSAMFCLWVVRSDNKKKKTQQFTHTRIFSKEVKY